MKEQQIKALGIHRYEPFNDVARDIPYELFGCIPKWSDKY
jgi:hypothetical protein